MDGYLSLSVDRSNGLETIKIEGSSSAGVGKTLLSGGSMSKQIARRVMVAASVAIMLGLLGCNSPNGASGGFESEHEGISEGLVSSVDDVAGEVIETVDNE